MIRFQTTPAINHIFACFALIFSTPLVARPLSGESASGEYRLSFVEPAPGGRLSAFKLGSLQLTLKRGESLAQCELTEFNLWMPEHRHGMNTTPVWERGAKKGEWLIKGVKLHMAGAWELMAKVRCDAKDITFTMKLKV